MTQGINSKLRLTMQSNQTINNTLLAVFNQARTIMPESQACLEALNYGVNNDFVGFTGDGVYMVPKGLSLPLHKLPSNIMVETIDEDDED